MDHFSTFALFTLFCTFGDFGPPKRAYVGVRGISKRSAAPNGISSGFTPTDARVCVGTLGERPWRGMDPTPRAVARRSGGRPDPKTVVAPQLIPPKVRKSAKKCTF